MSSKIVITCYAPLGYFKGFFDIFAWINFTPFFFFCFGKFRVGMTKGFLKLVTVKVQFYFIELKKCVYPNAGSNDGFHIFIKDVFTYFCRQRSHMIMPFFSKGRIEKFTKEASCNVFLLCVFVPKLSPLIHVVIA